MTRPERALLIAVLIVFAAILVWSGFTAASMASSGYCV